MTWGDEHPYQVFCCVDKDTRFRSIARHVSILNGYYFLSITSIMLPDIYFEHLILVTSSRIVCSLARQIAEARKAKVAQVAHGKLILQAVQV